jgi:NADH-quinone oxidoreductase subunit C
MSEHERVEAAKNVEALKAFRDQGYNVLVDLTALDYSAWSAHTPGAAAFREYTTKQDLPEGAPPPQGPARFDVVYRLMKLDPATGMDQGRVEVRCAVEEGEAVLRSVASLWPVADWLEREVWDMFGIRFADRSKLKRLLMYEEFVGHPLKKDYPIGKRQPLIGPADGELKGAPTFNREKPAITGE